jgi:outer membrane protein TolC
MPMTRYFVLWLLLTGHCLSVWAQNPPTKTTKPTTSVPSVPLPSTTAPARAPGQQAPLLRIVTDLSDTAMEDKLVALALNGPDYDITVHQARMDELAVKQAKETWLNLLAISGNYNDQTFAKQTNTAYVYPKYLIGITIPLGIIFSQGNSVKSARESMKKGLDQQEITARQLRTTVLGKYKQFKMYTNLIEMETEVSNDVQANFSQAEENFRQGKITVDAYIAAQRLKNEEMTKILNLQLQEDLIRLDIERMIGVPLDQVLYAKPRSGSYRP